MLSVVINDSAFAAILGVSFTSSIGLMAWIVKTLAGVAARVESVEDRVDRLETARWSQLGGAKLTALIGALFLLVAVFWGGLYLKVASDTQRREDACHSRQNLYDGQITYTRFLGRQFGVTPAQLEAGLKDLRKELGPRPTC